MDIGFLSKKHRKSFLKKPPVFFFLLSVFFHILILSILKIELPEYEEDELVKISFVRDSDEESVQREFTPEEDKKERKKDKRPEQVVDTARPEKEEKPEEARFSAEYDNKVKEESRSAFDKKIDVRSKKLQRETDSSVKQESRTVQRSGEKSKEGESEEHSDDKKMVKKGQIEGFEGEKGDLQSGERYSVDGLLKGEAEKNETGEKYAGKSSISQKFLLKSEAEEFRLSSPSNDHFRKTKEGDKTDVNTKRFVFADYFNRIKRAVSFYWNPMQVYLVNDPRGNIYGQYDRYTRLQIKLDRKGDIADIKIMEASGADFLDREALNAFKNAAPFPNPPEQLLEEGLLSFGFTFYVKYNK